MKPNLFLCLMAFLLSLLIGYFIYNIAEGKANDIVCGVVSLFCLTATLIPVLGIKYESQRLGVNLRVLSTIAFVVLTVMNLIFAWTQINMPNYLILNGIILILFEITFYRLLRIKDV